MEENVCFGIFMPSHFLILLAAAVVRLNDDEGFNGDAFFSFLNGPLLSRAMMAKSLCFCDREFEINSFRGLRSLSLNRDNQ